MLSKFKIFLIFIGDIIVFYGSLALSLFIRQLFNAQPAPFFEFFKTHLLPFSLVLLAWILIFYLASLYDPKNLKNSLPFFKDFSAAVIISGIISVIFFYLFPIFGITPKTNLFLFILTFGILGFLWHYAFNRLNSSLGSPEKVLLINTQKQSALAQKLTEYIQTNPQLGYKIEFRFTEENISGHIDEISKIISENRANLIIIPSHLKEKAALTKIIYDNLALGIKAMNFPEFYELIFKKIPLSELEEAWFLENIAQRHYLYDSIKRPIEFLLALLLTAILSPLLILIFILTKITSPGPAIFKQIRVGQNKKGFVFYKFRSMAADHSPRLLDQGQAKITPLGKILRKTHLDELPQLLNILKGDLSFIGPRPDFMDYFNNLKNQIPFYEIRTVIKPGITGWAQINYPITISVEQTKERLSYDLYYLKNRSPLLDIAILVKTIRAVLTASGF